MVRRHGCRAGRSVTSVEVTIEKPDVHEEVEESTRSGGGPDGVRTGAGGALAPFATSETR
jgi:hypothetical protein